MTCIQKHFQWWTVALLVMMRRFSFMIHEGHILGGRICKILPGVGGFLVQIGPYLFERVNFTENQ